MKSWSIFLIDRFFRNHRTHRDIFPVKCKPRRSDDKAIKLSISAIHSISLFLVLFLKWASYRKSWTAASYSCCDRGRQNLGSPHGSDQSWEKTQETLQGGASGHVPGFGCLRFLCPIILPSSTAHSAKLPAAREQMEANSGTSKIHDNQTQFTTMTASSTL